MCRRIEETSTTVGCCCGVFRDSGARYKTANDVVLPPTDNRRVDYEATRQPSRQYLLLSSLPSQTTQALCHITHHEASGFGFDIKQTGLLQLGARRTNVVNNKGGSKGKRSNACLFS